MLVGPVVRLCLFIEKTFRFAVGAALRLLLLAAAAAALAAAFLSPASRYNPGKKHSRRLPQLTRPLFACLCRHHRTVHTGATAAAAQQAMFKSNYPGCPSQDLLQVRVVVAMRRVTVMISS